MSDFHIIYANSKQSAGLASKNEEYFIAGLVKDNLYGNNHGYKSVIRKIKQNFAGSWDVSEIRLNLGGLENSITDINTIHTLKDSTDFIVGGFTVSNQGASAGDNGYLARVSESGNLIWGPHIYGPTSSTENLFDSEICDSKIIAAFKVPIFNGFTVEAIDINTGVKSWEFISLNSRIQDI